MAYRMTPADLRIVRAAILVALEGDQNAWDELSGDEIDRAQDLLEALEADSLEEAEEDSEEEEAEEEDGDLYWGRVDEDSDEY